MAPSPSPPYTTRPGQRSQNDPFLRQSDSIPLTERDRQEGYDVDLLHAQPRGSTAATSSANDVTPSRSQSNEKYGGGYAGSSAGGYGAGSAAGVGAATGAGTGAGLAEAAGARNTASYGNGAGKEGGGSGGAEGLAANSARPKKKWYMRPLALGIIIGLIIAVALAVGLGVGLSQASNNSSSQVGDSTAAEGSDGSIDDNPTDASGALSSATRSRSSRTASEDPTSGTVVPSSLYSSFLETASLSSSDDDRSSLSLLYTTDVINGTAVTVPIPFNGTTRATGGNLPIPVGSATTIGSEVVSVITSTSGARRVRRRTRFVRKGFGREIEVEVGDGDGEDGAEAEAAAVGMTMTAPPPTSTAQSDRPRPRHPAPSPAPAPPKPLPRQAR